MADILDGDPISPVEIPITDGIHHWYALAWDPMRDVIWAMDWNDSLPWIYTIDPDTALSTFQFSYGNLPGSLPFFLDGMGYDPSTDSLWMSEDFEPDVWEVSTTPGPGDIAQLITHFTAAGGDSGTVASFTYVWHTDPLSETVRRTDKDGSNLVTYLLPDPDTDYEEDMEFDPVTLRDGCLLWIIDREVEPNDSSKIEAYLIPCDRPVGGEILPVNTLQLIAPYLMLVVLVIGTVSVVYEKRRR
jgi:hypothetical protein